MHNDARWEKEGSELVNKFLTHVESDRDNVEAHCGVCNTTEG